MALKDFIRKMRYGDPIIVVSGLPRSGTSMLMKMLESGGLTIVSDGQRGADIDNPKGYFEFEKVKELDKNSDKVWLHDCRGKVVKIISYLLKDLPNDNYYKVLFIERDLREVMASQAKMLTNRGEATNEVSDEKMIENFENHLWRTRYLLKNEDYFDVLYVKHGDIMSAPQTIAKSINAFLGNHLNVEKMVAAVDPKLYRNRAPSS